MSIAKSVDGIPRIIGLSPLERPDAGLIAAVAEAGALGVLDLGRDRVAAGRALDALRVRGVRAYGVRIPEGSSVVESELPAAASVVVVADVADVARFATRRVLAQVTSLEEARAAVAAGAYGVIAKGSEAGGRIGEETTFVLVQHLVAKLVGEVEPGAPGGGQARCPIPVWAQGGIGMYTAGACIAGGAAGVVLDGQLALVRESSLPADVRAAIGAMDGSETVVIAGHRVYTRPDLPVAQASALDPAGVRACLGGDDLARSLLPIGQDGAFARSLARSFPSATQLVRGFAAAIGRQIAMAAEVQPLAPGSALAATHGLRYPIAQGPMSRVSDRARFAQAVAEAGALPFLALALMTGPEVRELLRETQALLGGRAWGIGILGFVPPEVREQQLAVLAEIPPPVALIAGGRPSQARPLELQGTTAYLHAPSPGLLDLFLRDGARRFVFEGRECGGHVGPRSSFVLWELQLERLLAHPDPAELSVLFAGGIHDARSAAMVAVMAAPLAARGAKIGVLMGTAYLFTDEAVAAGAIQPGFQAAAVACERTVLLETAPGHATRCADTAYAEAFAHEKARLQAAGMPAQEMWAALEQQNLGRLRIAAKGLRRERDAAGAITQVDPEVQEREGMFMIGQAAALRQGTCTLRELHREVSVDSSEWLAAAASRVGAGAEGDAPRRGANIALIGLAGIFPGAPDTDTFWANIVGGKNAIREVPPERWSAAVYYDPQAAGAGDKVPSKWGGFLDEVPFDPLAYGIPPKSLAAIEPVQLLSLEVAQRALADAGYAERAFDRERTAVIFGAEGGADLASAYSFRAQFPHFVGPLPAELDAALPAFSEDSFPGVLSNVIAGRIANRLDLGSLNCTVDAACAASLAAIDLAVKELASGASDMVLCGGADLHNGINDYLMFASVHALSPTGQCHTFDAAADGIVLGEGIACVVLKRLADAERDGDRIYAVIKGVAGASDGKSLGLTAPRKAGQVRALARAYEQAGVSPAEVGLVEAHGTGTVVGDRTELATLTEVYERAGAQPGACVLGSVKSQIGHTKCAAGMAGLIKTALAIYHGVLPPTLNIKTPNPAWDAAASPFAFLDRARPWLAEQRVAAVSAFGFGGANFHVVLASHGNSTGIAASAAAASAGWPAELFLVRGADRAAALVVIDRVRSTLARAEHAAPRLRDLARSVCAMGGGPVQVAIVAESVEDLRGKLAAVVSGKAAQGVAFAGPEAGSAGGKLAFLCPGQGSQRPGMLAELFVAFPRLRRWLELGAKWTPALFPAAAFSRDERAAQAAALTDTRVAQPALGMADLAVAELLGSLGVHPDFAGGHSYGELAALCVAGALGDADLLALSEARGEAILAAAGADPGTMLAVAAGAATVAPIIAGCADVVIANHNSPAQCVLSGAPAAIEAAIVLLGTAGLTTRRIPVACAFHSPIVAGARVALSAKLAEIAVRAPRIPVWSNVTGERYAADPDAVRALLSAQVAAPVQFAREIESMYAAGARIFIETGPGQVLARLAGEILGDRAHVTIACDAGANDAGGLRQFLRALGALAVAGVPVDPAPLFCDRDAALLELDPERAGAPVWLVNGSGARPATGPAPVRVARPSIGTAAVSGPAAAPVAARDAGIVEYLRTMRTMIAAQRDVLLAYLGQAPSPMTEIDRAFDAPALVAGAAASPIPAAAALPAASPAPAAPAAIDPLQLVVSIVSERTGYPIETLGIDLDLEADLSIDSIKRIEIIGELAQRVGLRVQNDDKKADAIVEELATRKTLRALIDWLAERLAKPPGSVPTASSKPATDSVTGAAPGRYRLDIVPAPAPVNGYTTFSGQRFVIHGGGDVAAELAARLAGEGAVVRHIGRGERVGEVDGFVDLAAVDSIGGLGELFERVRSAALGGARTLLVATAHGELGRGVGGGLGGAAGLVKTVAAEWPAIQARVVDLEPGIAGAAALLHAELHARDPYIEIGYVDGVRSRLEVVPAAVVPAGEPALGPDAVVLVTGGGRGITARVARALAERYGCHIELVGRSPLPPAEDPALASAADATALRRLLAQRGASPAAPAEIERRCARVLADREIHATLAALGAQATYHAIDVRTAAFGALIDDIYARRGRLDGVIHGAGVLEDKLIRDKTAESFERVVATKLAAAGQLVEKLRPGVGFVVLFSSISGVFGNRGQVDYATAGDALDKLAWAYRGALATRVVSIDWGPWAGTGMVSPALARDYARRGIALIDPARGIEALFAELGGAVHDAQVIVTASEPRAFVRPDPPPRVVAAADLTADQVYP